MVKRKVSEGDIPIPVDLLKKKKVSVICDDDFKGNLNLNNSNKLMDSLLAESDFFKTYWEKKPYYLKRNNSDFYGNLFTFPTLKEILDNNELDYQTDVNVCRYVNGEKELLNGTGGRITRGDVDILFSSMQATFQFHHPQRYVNILWNMLEKMETYFGSLVGSNIYITPKDSQGLAPHCDDVEIFVLQLEGEKEWKLYKPMVELSRDYTQDLSEGDIGEPTLVVTLKPGDLLYFPRGTIHQCKTVGDSHSTHISISTYQQNTWGDFLNHAVTQAIENALEDDVKIRSGLPLNYVSFLGTAKNMDTYVVDENVNGKKLTNEDDPKVKGFKTTVKDYLSKLVDHIDVNTAADAMSADFMVSRLPPYGHVEKEDEEFNAPTLDDKIKMRYPEHVRVEYCDDDENQDHIEEDEDDDDSEDEEKDEETEEMEQDEKPVKDAVKKQKDVHCFMSPKKKPVKSHDDTEDEDDEEFSDNVDMNPHIKILHSLNNDRFSHMGGSNVFEESTGCIKLNVHFAKAAVQVLNSKDFMSVRDLVLEEDSDKLTLAATLYADDLIEVQKD